MWKHKNFINLQLCAGETWVLNETIDVSTAKEWSISYSTTHADGTNVHYTKLYISVGTSWGGFHNLNGWVTNEHNATTFYTGDTTTWEDSCANRTFTFATPPTGDLLTWLQANGTKQSTPQPTLAFKHFYDAGTIGTGTVKFRHYSQTEPSSATLINFTINDSPTTGQVQYQAEEGMTWQQFVNSSYNTNNSVTISTYDNYVRYKGRQISDVTKDNVIIANKIYKTNTGSSGGGID